MIELRVDPARLLARFDELAKVGALPSGGVSRLALTDAESGGSKSLIANRSAIGPWERFTVVDARP